MLNLTRIALCACLIVCSAQAQDDDMAAVMLKAMKDQPTMYTIALPPNPEVGMWWEHTASTVKMRYSIVAERDGKLVLEQEQSMGDATLVNAWLVDPSVDTTAEPVDGKPFVHNVTKAWIGVKGGPAVERPVMEPTVYKKADAPEGTKMEFVEGDESVDLAGKSWDAHFVETADAKSWMVKGSHFLLRATYKGKVSMELTAMGKGAKSSLAWE